MCGIVGAVNTEVGAIDEGQVRRMCALITRRGPNDDGFYFGDRVGLGMRRLSIIDVHSGKQPIHNEDKSVWVVFNGEIYNYKELREDLRTRGHQLVTSSDTECLVHLYEEYGVDLVSHLRGMFAFALWDDRQKKLLLARDRLGIKPCYYLRVGQAMYFGSEMKCLLATEGFERRINLHGLSDYLTFKYVPGPQTIYEGIEELPPAHVATWCNGTLEIRKYWEIKPPSMAMKPIQYYAEGLLHQLEESVRLHLVSEVPLGAFLSGGIDSGAIVALMAMAGAGKVKTFTIGFDARQESMDERPYAKMVADRYRTEHSEYVYEDPQKQINGMLPAITRAFDEPFADSSTVPNFMICEAARKYVTVALSGTGGDELFAGYERYRGVLFAEHYRKIPRIIRTGLLGPLIRRLPEVSAAGLWIDRVKRFVDGADLSMPQRYQRFLAAFGESEKRELLNRDVLQRLDESQYSTPLAMNKSNGSVDALEWMLLTDMATYLPHDELRKTDRLSMWHSLEVRVPYLDHKVVEFASAIPAQYKLRGWDKKHVLKEAISALVPQTILRRRKQGFSIPLAQWLRGPLKDLVHMCLSRDVMKDMNLFNDKFIARLLDEHDRHLNNHETKIWTLLMFGIWYQIYMRRSTPF